MSAIIRVSYALWLLMALLLLHAPTHAAEFSTPQQLHFGDVYQLNSDASSTDDTVTCPKSDANDGLNGDNPYFRRFNVVRAHHGGCPGVYWYSSSDQLLCAGEPPLNTCPGSVCVDEPDPNAQQYVDYTPPFGGGASELTPGRYLITAQYRYTNLRPSYPAQYTVFNANGSALILHRQDQGEIVDSCVDFNLGSFDMIAGSSVRVEDSGSSSITFNRLRFTYLGPLGGVPYVNAGTDRSVILPASAHLDGTVADDGAPAPLVITWSKLSGPGTVTFGDEHAVDTTATFDLAGSYVLRLTATDTLNTVTDDVTVIFHPTGTTYRYTTQYEFDSTVNPDPSTPTGVLDADPLDLDGDGRLTKVGTGFGIVGGGFANGIMRYVDNTSSGNHGYFWNNGGTSLSFTLDMRVKANATTAGTLERRAMGFSAGSNKNRGMRISQPGSVSCPIGSVIFSATDGSKGPEGCVDLRDFHRLRVTVNADTNLFRVFDLDNHAEITSTGGGGSGPASQVLNLGGFHIGSIAGSGTTTTDFELDYVRVLLGTAVEDAITPIADLKCGVVFADADHDGDVDQDDFGVFQRCYTGGGGQDFDAANCGCLDREGDQVIDTSDLEDFLNCAQTSGPAIPWAPSAKCP